jgi:hypothetical protein
MRSRFLVLLAAPLAAGAPLRAEPPAPVAGAEAAAPLPAEEQEFDAHGTNVLRIEQEDKLTVPAAQAQAVWDYLRTHWVEDPSALRALDPAFTSYFNEELFADTYFDEPGMPLLAAGNGVRHRRRVNLTNPEDRKSGRELIQIKINDISDEELQRGEIKFEVRQRGALESNEDHHPFLGRLKRSDRADCRQRLTEIGVDAWTLRPILTIHDTRRRIYVLQRGKPFLSISFDHATAQMAWADFELFEVEPELNEIAFTEAGPEKRAEMQRVGAHISADLMARFPEIERNLTPKYNKAFAAFERQIPLLRLWVRTGLVEPRNLLLTGLVAALGLGVVALELPRRAKRRREAAQRLAARARLAS